MATTYTITCATPDATILYQTTERGASIPNPANWLKQYGNDGKSPITGVTVQANNILWAMAIKEGMEDSDVTSVTLT